MIRRIAEIPKLPFPGFEPMQVAPAAVGAQAVLVLSPATTPPVQEEVPQTAGFEDPYVQKDALYARPNSPVPDFMAKNILPKVIRQPKPNRGNRRG